MCVDDHRLMREGIALIIGLDPSLTVVAEASTGEEAVTHFVEQRPDVTLMDLQLPGMNGLQAINAIRRIQAVLPDLGTHLDRSVRTGTTCRYEP